jgi:hypothetical protein
VAWSGAWRAEHRSIEISIHASYASRGDVAAFVYLAGGAEDDQLLQEFFDAFGFRSGEQGGHFFGGQGLLA